MEGLHEEGEDLHLLAGAAVAAAAGAEAVGIPDRGPNVLAGGRGGAQGGDGSPERDLSDDQEVPVPVGPIPDPFPELRRHLLRSPGRGLEEDPGEGGSGEQRGIKRPREGRKVEGIMSELTLSLMTRKRTENKWFSEIWDEFRTGDMYLQTKYTFEQVYTKWLNPEDDWEDALTRYGKVALRPDTKYRLTKKVELRSCAYVIGNGAQVEVDTQERVAFACNMVNMGPGIVGMGGIIFHNVRFYGDNFSGMVIMANTTVLLHGCYFFGFNNTVLEVWGHSKVRGCTFYGCWKAIASRPKSEISVKKCLFERCTLGVCVEGKGRICNNVASENGCFALIKGFATLKYNMICGQSPTERTYQMLTCADGNVHLLKTVHITAHAKKPWPLFEHNVLTRCSVHLGPRRGIFIPHQCNFSHTNVLVETEAVTRFSLTGVFDMSVVIYKILRYEETKARCRCCECGGKHLRNQPVIVDVTEEVRMDHMQHSCARADYSTDEDTE